MPVYFCSEFFRQDVLNAVSAPLPYKNEWVNNSIEQLKSFSHRTYQRLDFKAPIFITANLIFFSKINQLAKLLEERVRTTPKKFNPKEMRFNIILIDYIVMGGSMLAFNLLLSKVMSYPLSYSTLIIMTIGSITLRSFSHETI